MEHGLDAGRDRFPDGSVPEDHRPRGAARRPAKPIGRRLGAACASADQGAALRASEMGLSGEAPAI
jgi:hypothetical protein